MKKNNQIPEDYLEKIPARAEGLGWSVDENGAVTLELENKGAFNKIAQKLLKKPKVSYIHLDENGSFVWQQIDGESDILKIGESVKDHFGEKAEPIYPRLSQFIRTLETYHFITFK
ncbi:MAG: PqqD family protein [Clostridia bacterium]|nr:PqqD family protein [Clostridia bacterium]